MNGWQPIETAPMDGSILVLLGNVGFGPCQAFARWIDDHWETSDGLIVSEVEGWRGRMFQYERYLSSHGLNHSLRTRSNDDDE